MRQGGARRMHSRYGEGSVLDRHREQHHEEPRDPARQLQTLPDGDLPPEEQRAVVWMYVAPLIPFAVIIWAFLIYWHQGGPATQTGRDASPAVATSGTSGGSDPGPRRKSTREELTLRGVGVPLRARSEASCSRK